MGSPNETPTQSRIECVPSTVTDSKNKLDTIDFVHHDEALKILLRYDGDSTWTAKEEAKLVRKIDRRLLVILVLTFAIQFYDKFLFSHAVSVFNNPVSVTCLMRDNAGDLWNEN